MCGVPSISARKSILSAGFAVALLLVVGTGARAADQGSGTAASNLVLPTQLLDGVGCKGNDECKSQGDWAPSDPSLSGLNPAAEIARGGSTGFRLIDGYAQDLAFSGQQYSGMTADTESALKARSGWDDVPLPRPASLALLGLGLVGIGIVWRSRFRVRRRSVRF